jgi:hypothetical protein
MSLVYPLNDSIDLEDAIRLQRIRIQELLSAKEDLKKVINYYSTLHTNSKLSYNIARQKSIIVPTDSISIKYDEKFLDINAKLDIKILIEDMKTNIPMLDEKALSIESQLHAYKMNANRAYKLTEVIPLHFKRTNEDLVKEMEVIGFEIKSLNEINFNSSGSITEKIQEYKKKCKGLQRQLSTLLKEKALLQETRDLYEVSYFTEEARITKLESHYNILCEDIRRER